MTDNLREGFEIVVVGIGGVFLNLLILMIAIQVVGFFFGKKKKPAAKATAKPATKGAK